MYVLGIDTSTAQTSVCIGGDRGVLASAVLGRAQAHGEFLSPAIRFCLEQGRVEVDRLAGVAVSLGPGLYTGMRVGIAAAQAFAHARHLPVVGLGSLDLLAYEFRYVRDNRMIAAVIDARRGQVFWAFYRPTHDGVQRVSELQVGTPDRLAGEVEATPEGTLCVGDGAVAHATRLASARGRVATAWKGSPRAEALVELATPRFEREETQRPEDLRAIYLRGADAKISWRKRGALAGGRPADAPPVGSPEG